MPTMRQRHSCISHGINVNHNALQSWHATMYKFVTSMVRCGLGMQQCAMQQFRRQPLLNWVYTPSNVTFKGASKSNVDALPPRQNYLGWCKLTQMLLVAKLI